MVCACLWGFGGVFNRNAFCCSTGTIIAYGISRSKDVDTALKRMAAEESGKTKPLFFIWESINIEKICWYIWHFYGKLDILISWNG